MAVMYIMMVSKVKPGYANVCRCKIKYAGKLALLLLHVKMVLVLSKADLP
jgi:hypothetical protein